MRNEMGANIGFEKESRLVVAVIVHDATEPIRGEQWIGNHKFNTGPFRDSAAIQQNIDEKFLCSYRR